jgi:hydroxypyruvate reductase
LGLNPDALLTTHNSHEFFSVLGDLVLTGPTRTNVNDYRALLVGVN